jgi:superfamily I DNA and/or RNA helicase
MIEEFYSVPDTNILLLSYTNRAVDEICDALDSISDRPPYIRIGSYLSCHDNHKNKLLECQIADCQNREEVRFKIRQHRIFVGTVASVSGKMELFRLKHFQVAIIDESSQILEPHLSGILSAKNPNGGNAIEKFILIGDHKQLPAVVLQKDHDSRTDSPALQAIGLYDRRNSLFERLYNLHQSNKNSPAWGMLYKHGRMHPDIAMFPNEHFYQGRLQAVPTAHQLANLEFTCYDKKNPVQKLVAGKRVAFIPSEKNPADSNNKINSYEADITVELVKNIYALHQLNGIPFSSEESIGIIAPYRSQIALIRRALHRLNNPELDKIMVDTVERFQGSQRDIIIYSFSVNYAYQLKFLSNTIEDEGVLVDRKLNVAITRAKKQLFITGNPSFLSANPIYNKLIGFIRSKDGYIDCTPPEFLSGNFTIA